MFSSFLEFVPFPPPPNNNKQLLDEVFVISRIIKVEVHVSVISLSQRLRLITPTETLIVSDVTKTESNNCFIKHCFKENNDKRIIAPKTIYFRQGMFLLCCPWTWHWSWKSCIACATYRLFTNLIAD